MAASMEDEMQIAFESDDAATTKRIGIEIGRRANPGDVLALSGELGSGKTCFAGGLAAGLGVSEDFAITSPTFTLINEYPARVRLYHMDVYRLAGDTDLADLGYDDILSAGGVVVIEWADRIGRAIPESAMHIHFEYLDETRRKITIRGQKQKLQDLAQAIKTEGN